MQVRNFVIALQALAKSDIYQAEHVTKKIGRKAFMVAKFIVQKGRKESRKKGRQLRRYCLKVP